TVTPARWRHVRTAESWLVLVRQREDRDLEAAHGDQVRVREALLVGRAARICRNIVDLATLGIRNHRRVRDVTLVDDQNLARPVRRHVRLDVNRKWIAPNADPG